MGIDSDRFTSSAHEFLICQICFDVFDDPHSVCLEEHTFCKSCCPVGANQTCPSCRSPLDPNLNRPSKNLSRIIGEFELKCLYVENGCDWTGPVSNDKEHTRNCGFREVDCTNKAHGCEERVQNQNLATHLRSCRFDATVCPRGGAHCGGDDAGRYKRSASKAHDNACLKWKCRTTPDCPTTGSLAMLATHEPACAEVHSRLKAVITSMEADSSEAAFRERRLLVELRKVEAEVEMIRAERKRLGEGVPRASPVGIPRPSRSSMKGERERERRRSASPPPRWSASRKRETPDDYAGNNDEDERRARMRRVGFGRDPLLPADPAPGGPADAARDRALQVARDTRVRAALFADRLHLELQEIPPLQFDGAPPPPPPPAARSSDIAQMRAARGLAREAVQRGGFAQFGQPRQGLPFGGGPPPPPTPAGMPAFTPPPKKPDGPPPKPKGPEDT